MSNAAELVSEGKTRDEVKNELDEYLSYEIGSPTNIRKVREILLYIWMDSEGATDVRDLALEAFIKEPQNRMAIRWCLLLLSYSIFSDITGTIGRLLNIQDTFSTA